MITWICQKDFWDEFETAYRPKGIYLNYEKDVEISLDSVNEATTFPPVDTPAKEADFPGPVLRWYGSVKDSGLFILTYHEEIDTFLFECEDDENKITKVSSELLKLNVEK